MTAPLQLAWMDTTVLMGRARRGGGCPLACPPLSGNFSLLVYLLDWPVISDSVPDNLYENLSFG